MKDDDQLSIFDGQSWTIRIYETYEAYKSIDFFLSYAINSGNEIFEEQIEALEKALNLKSKQMIIMFCTYIEVMIKDFLYTIYCEKPHRIENFLPNEFSGQFVKLLSTKKLDVESIKIFSTIAAKKSFDFNTNKTINIICDITNDDQITTKKCKDNFKKTKENFQKIFEIRNALIHDNKDHNTNLEKTIDILYLNIAPDFIKKLDSFCETLNIHSVREIKQKRKEKLDQLLKEFQVGNLGF